MKHFVAELPRCAVTTAGRRGQFVAAASSIRNIPAVLNDTGQLKHAPGPQGLEGGYPVRLSPKAAEIVLPPELSLAKCAQADDESSAV